MDLSSMDRITLICIIAESVLRYYDSSLVTMRSIAQRIHFLPEETDSSESLFRPVHPNITINRDTFDSGSEKEFLDGFGLAHRSPKVLALGVIMVQICQGCFHQTSLTYEGRTITNCLLQGERLLRSEHWLTLDFINGRVRRAIRKTIQACSDRSSSDYAQGRESTQLRKDFVRENIVLPLRTIACHLNFVCKGNTTGFLSALPASTFEPKADRRYVSRAMLDASQMVTELSNNAQRQFTANIQPPPSGENKGKQCVNSGMGSYNDVNSNTGIQNNLAQNDGSYNRQYHAQVMVFINRHE